MKYLLDTNICILLFGDGYELLRQRVRGCDRGELGISAITFAEIAWGSWNGRLPPLVVLNRFVQDVPVVEFGELAAKYYADLPFKRRSFDNLIAAHARALNLILVTNNERDFRNIEGLGIENWVQ